MATVNLESADLSPSLTPSLHQPHNLNTQRHSHLPSLSYTSPELSAHYQGNNSPSSLFPIPIISGLGSPSLEDYGLRKWQQIAGGLEMQDTSNLWDVKRTCGQAGSSQPTRRWSCRRRAPADSVAGGAVAPSDPVGLGQAEPGSGLVPLREERVQGMAVGAHTNAGARVHIVTPCGDLYCRCQAHWSCVCVCDKSITPIVRSEPRSPAHHCSLAVSLIDILIGRFECRL